MNDHDLDLIVDLIENHLSDQEAEAALARIAGDPELQTAYDEQLAVHASLSALPAAAMTTSEKESLHTALVAQLRMEEAAAVVPIAPKRRAWWMPVVGIATAAAAITAIVIIPGMSSSDDSSTETTIVASAAARAPEAASADEAPTEESLSDGELDMAAAQAPVTVVELEGADLVDVLDATAGESSPEVVQDQLNSLGFTKSALIPPDVLAECISRISGQLPPNTTDIVLFGVDTSGPVPIAHVGLVFDADDGIEAAMSIDLESCAIVDLGN